MLIDTEKVRRGSEDSADVDVDVDVDVEANVVELEFDVEFKVVRAVRAALCCCCCTRFVVSKCGGQGDSWCGDLKRH